MKLISKDGAIAALRVIPDEVKPVGGVALRTLVAGIAKRYQFLGLPQVQTIDTAGAKFTNGNLDRIAIKELQIFSDLIGVTTNDTRDAEAVVNDLYGWLQTDFGFRAPTTKPVRVFQSDLIVEFENDPTSAFRAFDPLLMLIKSEVDSLLNADKKIEFARLDFATPPHPETPTAQFLVERRAGVPWETNRFFCKAHMHTDVHIKALELLDELFGKVR